MWWKHTYFKYITAIILGLIAFMLMRQLNIFHPFLTIFKTLFYPILIAGFLFYLIRPFVEFIAKPESIPNSVGIILVFTFIAGLLFAGIKFLADTITKQVENISTLPKQLKETANEAKNQLENNGMGLLSTNSLVQEVTQYFGSLTQQIGDHLMQVFTTVIGATTVMIIVPFVLFFFLKDGEKFIPFLTQKFEGTKKVEAANLLHKMDKTVSAYIIGQVTVAIVDGVLMFIGYLIIGLDYALILAMFVSVTAIIPFFGPIIGVIPALVVALMQDPMMAIYVLILLIVVQQLEGNLVAPVVLSNRLNVHPLTIILLLVVAFPLAGFIGMIIVIPLYSVCKVIINSFYKYYQLYYKDS